MGNSFSNKIINEECPICLDKTYNPIKLHCNHQFCLFCIQKWSLKYIYFRNNIECPMCRQLLFTTDYNNIFKKCVNINYNLEEYVQCNIFNIQDIKIKIKTIDNIALYSQYGMYNIGIPRFNTISNPGFLKIPRVYRIKHIMTTNDSIINLTNRLSYAKTDYGESIGKYKFVLEAFIGKTRWMDILVKKFYKLELLNTDMIKNIYDSKDKITLYVKNPRDVLVIDIVNGTMSRGLKIMNFISEIIFKIIIITDNDNNVFLINELQCIKYYE